MHTNMIGGPGINHRIPQYSILDIT